MVREDAAKVFQAVTSVRIIVGLLCGVVAVAIILITLLILRRESRELMVVEGAISRLGELNLSAGEELDRFSGREDEIGRIARTAQRVCGCLRETIDDVGRVLGEMTEGRLTVNVKENEGLYIGDFRVLWESLQAIHTNLTYVIRDITQVARQVDTSADHVSAGGPGAEPGHCRAGGFY